MGNSTSPSFESYSKSTLIDNKIRKLGLDIGSGADFKDKSKLLEDIESALERHEINPKIIFKTINFSESAKMFVPKSMNPYGFVHTCIKVGPFYLEWNTNALIDISFNVFSLRNAILVVDLPSPTKNKKLIAKDIADVIFDWNANKSYSSTFSNCQHFVNLIISKGLGLNQNMDYLLSEEMNNVLKILQETGKFDVGNVKYFDGKLIKSHSDLDFLMNLKEMEKNWKSGEREMTKSLDRAFWFNYLALEDYISYLSDSVKSYEKTLPLIHFYGEEALDSCCCDVLGDFKIRKKFRTEILQLEKLIHENNTPAIQESLKVIYSKFVGYSKEKLKKLKDEQIHSCNQPLLGWEFIKKYFLMNLEGDLKSEFEKFYENDSIPSSDQLKIFLTRNTIQQPPKIKEMFENYNDSVCFCKDPRFQTFI